MRIGDCRCLDIKVIKGETETLYSGNVDDAPDEIKNLNTVKIDGANPMVFYVADEC